MKIVYLPPIPFDGLKQRPQYLAEELAREHEVLYIDPTVSLMKFLCKGGSAPGGYSYEVGDTLHVLRLNGMFSVHRSLEAVWGGFCFSERLQLRKHLAGADLVWIGYSPWYGLIKGFSGIVVYDKMDEEGLLTRNRLMRRLIRGTEPALEARADHIFVTAKLFQARIAKLGKRSVLVPNAVEREQAFSTKGPVRTAWNASRVFGYVGMIGHWFDTEAIRVVLQEDAECHVILVGPVEGPVIAHERVHYIGCVPKGEVGSWIEAFDVCLYPFRRTELLDTIDPVKIYEYLAANKPVLAARSIETEKFGAYVACYGNNQELAELLHSHHFQPPFRSERERRKFVFENDWQSRGRAVREELEGGHPGA